MAKINLSAEGNVDFRPFANEEEFYRWVRTNHGSNVEEACKTEVQQNILQGQKVKALQLVDNLDRVKRSVTLSKQSFRAQFVY